MSQSPEGSSTHCNPPPAPNPLPCERPQSSLRDPRRCRLQLPGYRAPRHHMSCLSPIFSNTSASRALTGIFSPRERSRKRGGEQPTALPVFETPFLNAGDYTTKEAQSNHLHANSRVPHEMARGRLNHPKALLIIFTDGHEHLFRGYEEICLNHPKALLIIFTAGPISTLNPIP